MNHSNSVECVFPVSRTLCALSLICLACWTGLTNAACQHHSNVL